MLVEQADQQRRHDLHAEDFRNPEPHHAVGRHLGAADLLGRRQRRPFHRLGMRQQGQADLGQLIALARAVEQGRAELGLEPVDAARDGRVLDVEAARGARQRAGARQFEEKAQVRPLGKRIHEIACQISR